MFNRSIRVSFVKDKKIRDGEDTQDGNNSLDLEAIQDFIVNTVAGVGLTVMTVKIVATVCDVVKNATQPK